ncbi:MarR family winged helix-turn-helix transcriptional regulator [Amycolatopsis sp. CA-230715]|uniref:MarR family winged helix-turn-helix transcriptional regulator n=1 Tax=Amycolatopsis sp. CA-230715 TaxID=2745196 RepID=UPI001C32A3C6|nr:MarR family transcriptional regulator [Amycolatopsis sp. CA-230715]QWF82292.1 hypothetical protein HUW46_05729 [Amycolatopsis sp. CA-230715]
MADFDWLTEEEQRVYRAFSRMSRELFNHFDCDLKRDVGIPRTYYEVLFVLGEAPEGLRMTDLAAATRSAPSRITHAVGKLAADGLVHQRTSAADRRSSTVHLTDEGERTLRKAAKRHARSVREYLFAALTDRQADELRRISDKIFDRVEEATAPEGEPR